jgi:hypothetical protein
MLRLNAWSLVWAAFFMLGDGWSAQARSAERPILAIWQESNGNRAPDRETPPFLRVAIWADGRVVFAPDPERWSHKLREGRIALAEVEKLKARVAETGVFELKGTTYLVPDADVDCLMVDFGPKRRQMLYWDEVETPGYGINIDPKPQHLRFKACWKAVNALALAVRPEDAESVAGHFPIPKTWRLRPAIQSE